MLTLGLQNRNTGCQRCSVRCSSMLNSPMRINSHTKFQLRFPFSTVTTVKRMELHHYAKFCRNLSNRSRDNGDFAIFQDGGRRNVGFLKCQIFNDRKDQECRSASVCQISSNSLELRPRYRDFSWWWHILSLLYYKFTAKFVGERISKIGQYFAKLEAEI